MNGKDKVKNIKDLEDRLKAVEEHMLKVKKVDFD